MLKAHFFVVIEFRQSVCRKDGCDKAAVAKGKKNPPGQNILTTDVRCVLH